MSLPLLRPSCIAIALISGCTANSAVEPASPVADAKPTAAVVAPEPIQEQQRAELLMPQVSEDPEATIEALRRKSESHARTVETMIQSRSAAPAEASAVRWQAPQTAEQTPQQPAPAAVSKDLPPATPPPESKPAGVRSTPAKVVKPDTAGPTQDGTAVTDVSNQPLELAQVDTREALASVSPAQPVGIGQEPNPLAISAPAASRDPSLSSRLQRRVTENPLDLSSHLDYQMLLFLQDEQVPNLAAIATLPQEDRELVTAVLDGLTNLRATLRRDPNLMIAEKIQPLVDLTDRLKTTAELRLPALVLASRVEGFGRYDQMEPRIIGGKDTPAIVYCEVENFSSQLNAEQKWETNLSMEVVLFSENGQQVFNDLPATITDTCGSRRRDFFVRKLITLPSKLTIGRYVLKVTMVDTQSNRVAESSLPLQVVAQ